MWKLFLNSFKTHTHVIWKKFLRRIIHMEDMHHSTTTAYPRGSFHCKIWCSWQKSKSLGKKKHIGDLRIQKQMILKKWNYYFFHLNHQLQQPQICSLVICYATWVGHLMQEKNEKQPYFILDNPVVLLSNVIIHKKI